MGDGTDPTSGTEATGGAEPTTGTSSNVDLGSETDPDIETCPFVAGASAPEPLYEGTIEVPANIPRLLAADDGTFYATGDLWTRDAPDAVGGDGDIYVSRLAADGSPLWFARWGSTTGWRDTVADISATPQAVYVAGIAGTFESQEYYYEGNPFVRGYGDGGTVLWTWQGEPQGTSFDIPSGIVVAAAEDHIYAGFQRRADDGTRSVRLFHFSPDGTLTQTWDAQPANQERLTPLTAQVLRNGNLQIVGATYGAPWLGEWSPDGQLQLEVQDPEKGGPEAMAAAISDSGAIVLTGTYDGNGENRLPVWSYDAGLTHRRRSDLEIDDEVAGIFFGPSISVACDGSIMISTRVFNGEETVMRTYALAPDLTPLWEAPGLGSSAVTRDGVLLQAGFEFGPKFDEAVTLTRTSSLQ